MMYNKNLEGGILDEEVEREGTSSHVKMHV